MRNIVLIGMPGSGKSTVGVLAAKALGISFVDTDLLLQRQIGCLLQEYIQRRGIEAFLDEESRCLRSIRLEDHIIATGGSAVLRADAMEALAKGALCVVYLDLPPDALERRLTNIRTRGIAMEEGQTIRQLYDARAPLYRAYATHAIPCAGQAVEETVSALTDLARSIQKAPTDEPPRGSIGM